MLILIVSRDVTISSIDETSNTESEITAASNEVSEVISEESYTPPQKKQSLSNSPASSSSKLILSSTAVISDKSMIGVAEPANATFSSENDTAPSGIIDATFDVGSGEKQQSESEFAINNQTFDASKVPSQNNSQDDGQFIEAEIVEKPQEVASNIVEILKSAEKVGDNLPSPIPAPRAINKVLDSPSVDVDDIDNKPTRSTRTKQKLVEEESTTVPCNAAPVSDNPAAKRSTRTKTKNPSGDSDAAPPTRSTRTRQKVLSTDDDKTASENEGDDGRSVRTSRTRQKIVATTDDNTASETEGSNENRSVRSSRTRQKVIPTTDEDKTASETEGGNESRSVRTSRIRQKIATSTDEEKTASETESGEDARPSRSTRTKQKQLASSCSESVLMKGAASPRVRQLAAQVLSPALKQSSSTSRLVGGYTGSPVKDRVRVFEQAMKESAGLKSNRKSKRKSSIQVSLEKASAARNISVGEIINEQEVVVKKGPTIRKSPGVSSNTSALNNSRAPAGKVVRPGRKVLASGGRGFTPSSGPKSGSHTGSSSNLMKSRSRLDIIERNKTTPNKANPPSNIVRGVTSFLPGKPKGPTMQEIQEQKDQERRLKEQRG